MADFDNLAPPLRITDPNEKAPGFKEFPRHVYNADGAYVSVIDEKDMAKRAKDGYTFKLPPKASDHG